VKNKFIKILIVSDELISRRVLHSFLSPVGEVDVAVNRNKGLAAIKKAFDNNRPYELIFLDITMPEFDGIVTLKKIRQLESQYGLNEHARSKVIINSENTDKDVILKAARVGCSGYLINPIDKNRLYNEIRKHGFDISE